MTERTPLSERDVEGLLQRFFASEVPAEFRSEEPTRPTASLSHEVAKLPTSSRQSRQLAAYMAVAVSTICCLLVLTLRPEQPIPTHSASTDDSISTPSDSEAFVPVEERELLLPSSLNDPSAESSEDSEETIVPELEVEIFPLRSEKPE
ncbi:MAG: hypothetical protein HUJ26_07105 [Planctomycetaceae bacterium]|nr:hypothetical protein [Planctomycetaceae bacterium]